MKELSFQELKNLAVSLGIEQEKSSKGKKKTAPSKSTGRRQAEPPGEVLPPRSIRHLDPPESAGLSAAFEGSQRRAPAADIPADMNSSADFVRSESAGRSAAFGNTRQQQVRADHSSADLAPSESAGRSAAFGGPRRKQVRSENSSAAANLDPPLSESDAASLAHRRSQKSAAPAGDAVHNVRGHSPTTGTASADFWAFLPRKQAQSDYFSVDQANAPPSMEEAKTRQPLHAAPPGSGSGVAARHHGSSPADVDKDGPSSPAPEDQRPSRSPALEVSAEDAYDPGAGYGGHGDPPGAASDQDSVVSEGSYPAPSGDSEGEDLEAASGDDSGSGQSSRGYSSDEEEPSPRFNARLVSHKEDQHQGSPDLVTSICHQMDESQSGVLHPRSNPDTSRRPALERLGPHPCSAEQPTAREQFDRLRRIDQARRQAQQKDLFQAQDHPCDMEREIGRRRVLHQPDSSMSFGTPYQDPYKDESQPTVDPQLMPALLETVGRVAELSSLHLKQQQRSPAEIPRVEPPQGIPDNELLPPPGFVMPGLSDQYVSDEYAKWWRTVNPGVQMPRDRPLIPGRPLEELAIDIGQELRDEWTVAMEEHAAKLRSFMLAEPVRNTSGGARSKVQAAGSHWQVKPGGKESKKKELGVVPPGKSRSDPPAVEVLDPVGVPVPPFAEDMLQKVAYAPTCLPTSGYAQAVRVPEADYQRTLQWNSSFAAHEATPIADPESRTKQAPQKTIDAFINQKPRNKLRFKTLRDAVKADRDSLKCHFASAAAAEATQRAADLLEESVCAASQNLGTLLSNLKELGFLQGSFYEQTSLFRQIQTDLRQAQQGVDGLRSSAHYLAGSTQAGADAAARGIRVHMQSLRTETLRGVFSIPEAKQDTDLEQAAVKLPYTPSSLFGGRLQASINLLGEKADRRRQFNRAAASYTGGKAPCGQKRPAETFPEGGDDEPPTKKEKRRFRKRGSGKNRDRSRTSKPSTQAQAGGGGAGGSRGGSGGGGTNKHSNSGGGTKEKGKPNQKWAKKTKKQNTGDSTK